MSLELTIRNRQRRQRVDVRLLRQITTALLTEVLRLDAVELGISIVAAPEMARLNWQFLQHEGSTDVITFDHSEAQESRRKPGTALRRINGELFVCLDEAVVQARSFRTTWQAELVRYIVHGILHLLGHDDHAAAALRRMKREENRTVRLLAARFAFSKLGR